jgi:hypothetical protein
MIVDLQRVTTMYVALEDRVRLSGEVENAAPVVVWMTQRLVLRLLPLLFRWLDNQTGAPLRREVIHDFAQQAAQAEIKRQPPVKAEAAGQSWLARSVNVTPRADRIVLVFCADDVAGARFSMTVKELRQWLSILHGAWTNATWPVAPWPEWIHGEAKSAERQIVLH